MAAAFIKRYSMALNRYKWVGLVGFLGVFGASGFVAVQPTPPDTFRSEGILVQNTPVVSFTATGVQLQQEGQGIITEDFLLADVLLGEVVNQLSTQGVTVSPDDIRKNTTIKIDARDGGRNRGNQLDRVTIGFNWDNREEAEAILSVLFQGMVEFSRITNRSRLSNIVNALDERLPDAEGELRAAEQALEAYDRIEGPAIQAALDGSLLGSISGSQNQRRQNQVTLAGMDSEMESLQAQLGLTPEQAYASSALSADPIIAQLRSQIYQAESQLQVLTQNLREAHPTIIDLRQSLAAYDRLLRERAREVIGGGELAPLPSGDVVRQDSSLDPARAELANYLVALKTQRDALIRQQALLAQSEAQLREEYSSLPNKQLERDRLAQQVGLKRALYDQIQAKRIDAQAAEAETVSSITIASPPATRRIVAESQNPVVVLLLGGMVGLVVGGGLVLLLDMLDGTMRTHEDLEKLLGDAEAPLLGIIPLIQTHSSHIPPLILAPDSAYGDLYERLRSNLYLAGAQLQAGKPPQMIMVTSTRDQEGKTITAFNLAIAAARAGRRTLILEADLRSHSQARLLGITPDEQAILEPLRYYGGYLSDPVQMVPGVENLYIAPSAGPQRNAPMVIDSSEMIRFLADAQARFDLVILDAPHLTGSNDTMLLQGRTDGIVLVTRPQLTEKPVLQTVLEQFEESEDIRVLGTVINGADIPIQTVDPTDPPVGYPPSSGHPEVEESYPPEQQRVPVMGPVDF
ncbi:polysaccharide biosynthesis tyrosine autokinase [Leptolyngbya sp. PCC 6406]|uniref:polysaccharide biosynthesis tyrosine autokinase n=1 Tax=Leptolyngbya sp. PCC 6406 TaxID=1173264 RepID=UPI0002AC6BC2|nr:tyrosine-protein kinase domain-containing protein [Leptolyngbya sp. PCC 6406]